MNVATSDSHSKSADTRAVWLLLALLLLLAGMGLAAAKLYQEREQRYRHRVELSMKVLNELQVQSVANWRDNHISNAMALSDDSLLAIAFRQWRAGRAPQWESMLRERLRILVERNRYTVAFLMDTEGRPLLASGDGRQQELPAIERQALRQALDEAGPVLVEPRRDALFAFPFFGVFAPLFDGNRPMGAIWLVVDMRNSLFPLLQALPRGDRRATSVLMQRQGDNVVNISPLGSDAQGMLARQSIPMVQLDHPAVQAFRGMRGVIYGHDERGREVLAVASMVPSSPWLLLSQADVEEAFADEQRREGLGLGLFIGLGLLLLSLAVGYWQRSVWRRERALKRELERNILWLNNAQKAASVGYFAYGAQARQFYMSDMACAIFGVPEIGSMSLKQWVALLHADDREQVLDTHARALAERLPLRAQYRIWRKSDGQERWVEVWGEYEKTVWDGVPRMAGTVQDITERKQAEEELASYRTALEEQVRTDPLTGVANRRALDEAVEREWARATRTGSPLALLMMDIDHFKAYNDHHGHLAGDQCLRRVARALQSMVRAGDLMARFGGEEFAMLLPETDAQQAMAVAEKLCEAVRALQLVHDGLPGGKQCVSISIGVVSLLPVHESGQGTGGEPQSQQLFSQADAALYRAKQTGRDRACLFQPPA